MLHIAPLWLFPGGRFAVWRIPDEQRVAVTLKNSAGLTSTASKQIALKAPMGRHPKGNLK